MQTTSAAYRTIIAGKYRVEYKAEIAGITYNQADIIIKDKHPLVNNGLFDRQFSIGNAIAAELDFWVKEKGTIPSMAEIDLYYRVANATSQSEWKPKGQFFIDVREKDFSGLLHITAFDAMLKANYTFMESGTWTSTTALATVQMIAGDMGVTINADTLALLTNDTKTVPSVPVIGENGTMGKEMLESIAAMYGGNFIIDELGELKLVQLVTPAANINIHNLTAALSTAPAFDAIDRVVLYSGQDKKSGYKSPAATYDDLTGRVLEAYCPWTSQELADDLLAIVSGYVYQPFKATGATIDPAMQLGDGITVGGTSSVIFKANLTFDARCAADLSAPYEEEINHEYPYRSAAQRIADTAVTEEDLKTPGQTEINGANITTGQITLGGNNNGRGNLVLLDENNIQIGKWDNEGLIIFDDTASEDYAANARFKIVRKGSSADSEFGLQLGATQLYNAFFPGQYPNEVVPFIHMVSTLDGTDSDELFIFPTCTTTNNAITRSSGKSIVNQVIRKWGRVCQLTLVLAGSSDTYNVYAGTSINIFQGSVSEAYRPTIDATGIGYYDNWPLVARIQADGTLTVRLTGYGTGSIGGNCVVAITYLV